jgi:hypothetical protein
MRSFVNTRFTLSEWTVPSLDSGGRNESPRTLFERKSFVVDFRKRDYSSEISPQALFLCSTAFKLLVSADGRWDGGFRSGKESDN